MTPALIAALGPLADQGQLVPQSTRQLTDALQILASHGAALHRDAPLSLKHLARIGARLHPSARMRAEREGAALIARLGPAALAATGCSD